MGAISITCPTTGKPVSTGMTLEPESFYRSVLTGNSVKCPHCGITHIWSKADANSTEAELGHACDPSDPPSLSSRSPSTAHSTPQSHPAPTSQTGPQASSPPMR